MWQQWALSPQDPEIVYIRGCEGSSRPVPALAPAPDGADGDVDGVGHGDGDGDGDGDEREMKWLQSLPHVVHVRWPTHFSGHFQECMKFFLQKKAGVRWWYHQHELSCAAWLLQYPMRRDTFISLRDGWIRRIWMITVISNHQVNNSLYFTHQ